MKLPVPVGGSSSSRGGPEELLRGLPLASSKGLALLLLRQPLQEPLAGRSGGPRRGGGHTLVRSLRWGAPLTSGGQHTCGKHFQGAPRVLSPEGAFRVPTLGKKLGPRGPRQRTALPGVRTRLREDTQLGLCE